MSRQFDAISSYYCCYYCIATVDDGKLYQVLALLPE